MIPPMRMGVACRTGGCPVRVWAFVLGAMMVGLTGCSVPAPWQQKRVSQPNMVFSGSGMWAVSSRLTPQIETGRAGANGAQAAGCTTCR